MRLVSFLVMVFGALLSQYLLQTWLVNSEEERRQSWDSVVKISAASYSKSVSNLQWLARGSNWKYLFLVPSRVKAFQEKKGKGGSSGKAVVEEYDYGGIKIRFTSQDVADDLVEEESEEELYAGGDGSSSAAHSGGGSGKASSSSQRRTEAVSEDEYFAGSKKPRHPRPTSVKYRVGQVVKHRKYGFYGVIIGWDEVAKAPEDWFQQSHPKGKEHWRRMPNYSVMVDQKYKRWNYAYCAEENIAAVKNVQINHPDLSEAFSHFNGKSYIAQPWLQEIYPHDTER